MFDSGWRDEETQGKFAALANEQWYHKERQGTYLAYWLVPWVACIIGAIWHPPTDPWTALGLFGFFMFGTVCMVLWAHSWANVMRLRRLLKQIEPTYPL